MRNEYEKIEIPDNLSQIVDEAIDLGINYSKKNLSFGKKIFTFSFIFSISFVVLLNTVPVFAKAMYDISLIEGICKFLTFREYHFEDDIKYIDVKFP